MAKKPNYQFDRMERERAKAAKVAAKAAAKREQRALDADPSRADESPPPATDTET